MSHLERPTASARRQAGFTLIEGLATSSVLVIGLLAMTTTSAVVSTVRDEAVERELAESAMVTLVEALEAAAAGPEEVEGAWADSIVRRYAWDGTTGPSIEVEGLEPWNDRATVASVELIMDETVRDEELSSPAGMPRDLNGDGEATSTDVSLDAVMLPVVVSVRWLNGSGENELTQVVYLQRP